MLRPPPIREFPRRVLFLEDQPLIAMDTSEFLTQLGIEEVRVVHRLAAAEEAVSTERFDLAILDINVDRGQQSYELGSRLLKQGVPVVFASGTEVERPRLTAEGFGFLSKPYKLQTLRELILVSADIERPTGS